jgi:hypothetical protein
MEECKNQQIIFTQSFLNIQEKLKGGNEAWQLKCARLNALSSRYDQRLLIFVINVNLNAARSQLSLTH